MTAAGTAGGPVFDADVASAPSSRDAALLAALAADLTDLRYTVDGVETLLGPAAYASLGRGQWAAALLMARRLLGGAERARVVPALLWILGESVPDAAVEEAFPRTGRAGLLRLRLIEPDGNAAGVRVADAARGPQPGGNAAVADAARGPRPGGNAAGVRAAVDLRPYGSDATGDLWVASDLGSEQRPGPLRHDHVLGIGGASLTLAQTVVRTPVDRALDLGTGCGIQVFHLLPHARHVTATDISDRALAFARFNLLLNAPVLGLDPERLEDRVALRLGNLLEPVGGERFDLVVSNPPFVITPRSGTPESYTYRDGGLAGDAIVGTLVRELPGVLAPGGSAQLLGNWEIPAGAPWDRRVRTFLPAGVDAWVIQREQLSPEQYAETWLRDAAEDRDRASYLDGFAAHLADFSSRDVGGIGFGSVWLRRPAEEGTLVHVTLEEITHEIEQPIGPHLAAAIGRADWLAAQSAAQSAAHPAAPSAAQPAAHPATRSARVGQQAPGIADAFLVVADDVTEERHQRPGAEHPGVILLRQGSGLRRTALLSTELAGFASACDGDLTAGQIAGALAMLLDRPEPAFVTGLLVDVERLIREGFLIPAP